MKTKAWVPALAFVAVVSFTSVNNVGPHTLLATTGTGVAPTPTPTPTPTLGPPPIGCNSTPTLACLNTVYTVSVTWSTTDGRTGAGNAIPLTSDTAYFWFFSSSNVELVVKVLDGTAINGRIWVFYGALSNVQYQITVTNIATGQSQVYDNPQGTLASVADTSAF